MSAMKRMTGVLTGAAALALSAAPSFADDREFSWSVTATGVSDYVFRGVSLNNEDPAFQASIDAEYGIWYGGLWGSMVDGVGYEPLELNLYSGIKPVWGPVTFDLGVIYYFYPSASGGSDSDYVEFKLGAEFSPITNLTLTPIYFFTPDQGNAFSETHVYEGTAAYELPAVGVFTPSISGTVGFVDSTDAGADYTYWNAGLGLAVEKFNFDFRYWDTDISNDGLADERFVFTASITLP